MRKTYNYITGCLSLCKDTNFKANHNIELGFTSTGEMFVFVQRYEF